MGLAADTQANLAEICNWHSPKLVAAINAYRAARATLAGDDVITAMQATARLAIAAEAIKDAAAEAEAGYRKALAVAMIDTGCPAVRTEHHTVSITEPKPKLKVMDSKLLHPDYWKTKLIPDEEKIKEAHARGFMPAGVALTNGSAPFITIRAKKD
jgi:hypothetical protein